MLTFAPQPVLWGTFFAEIALFDRIFKEKSLAICTFLCYSFHSKVCFCLSGLCGPLFFMVKIDCLKWEKGKVRI